LRHGFCSGKIDVDDIVDGYKTWFFSYFYYYVLKLEHGFSDDSRMVIYAPKRGDLKYASIVRRKFESLSFNFKNSQVKCFNYGERGGLVNSRFVSLVFEYDSNRFGLAEAYGRVGADLNRALSLLRRRFGRIAVVRVFESHESGYPHIHVIVGFLEHKFSGRFMSGRYCVVGKDWKLLESCWSYGFVRNRLVDSFDGGIRYLSKYLIKNVSYQSAITDDGYSKGAKTLALLWLFGKRAYGISGLNLWSGLIDGLEGGEVGSDEIRIEYKSNSVSSCVGVSGVSKWIFEGFIKADHVLWGDLGSRLVSPERLVPVEPEDDSCNCLICRNRKVRQRFQFLEGSIDDIRRGLG
jgi:hypothetical protein